VILIDYIGPVIAPILLKVHNDVTLNIDTGKVTELTLLDLFAAFDTIDYSVLLDRLSDWYGISGTVLTWIHSKYEIVFQSQFPCFVAFPKALFLDRCCLLYILCHSLAVISLAG